MRKYTESFGEVYRALEEAGNTTLIVILWEFSLSLWEKDQGRGYFMLLFFVLVHPKSRYVATAHQFSAAVREIV